MSDYTLALFAHILGVIGLFSGIVLDWTTILRLRRAQSMAQVREATGLVGAQARLIQVSSLLILIAGAYMAETVWGWNIAWILVSLAALILMGALSGAVSARRLKAIQRAAAGESAAGGISPALQQRIADPLLVTASQTAAMIGLGVVFLMTTKPDLLGSLLTLIVAIALGVGAAQFWRRPRATETLAKEA